MTNVHRPWCRHHCGMEPADASKDPYLEQKRKKEEEKRAKAKVKDEKKSNLKKRDDNDKGGPGGSSKGRGLGFPAWMHGILGTGAISK